MAGTGGYRPGAGRPKGAKDKNKRRSANNIPGLVQPKVQPANTEIPDIQVRAPGKKMSALEYMSSVFNDPTEDKERRYQAARDALPYMHMKPGEVAKADSKPKGKKQVRQETAEAASSEGLYAIPAPPRVVISN